MKNVILSAILVIATTFCHAQLLTHNVIGSQGDFFWSPTATVAWTLGETMSETYASSDHYLTQGFHQPDKKRYQPDVPLDVFNGFSPNGDGINDSWSIPILVSNPKNTVVIINRWGNEVWKKDNYDNKEVVFKGDNMNGNALPDGTYYYIIHYSNIEKRGWVFIKR